MIRPTIITDKPSIFTILRDSNQFDEEGISFVEGILDQHLLEGSSAIWLTAFEEEPIGVAYCNPEPVSSGVWNLLMLWIREDKQRLGLGRKLVEQVELNLKEKGARLLLVETSSKPMFETARMFYAKCGFIHEATIRNYFEDGDDKLILTKLLKDCG